MLYSKIASALQDISQAPRSRKAELTSLFLMGIEPEMLCPVIRLFLGELWPPWEEKEMGIGPEAIMEALIEVSEEDVPRLREGLNEMGMVAEAALLRKGQHLLFQDSLQVTSVYERLRRISSIKGIDSEHRKNAILRGLFLEASSLEGKYIARTALRNMLVGIGQKTMISALSRVFNCDPQEIRRAYNIMPDFGLIACAALNRTLNEIKLGPSIPIKPMIIRLGDAVIPGSFLPRYPGLRVQVHRMKGDIFIFTSNLRNVTSILNGLSQAIDKGSEDFIIDAELIGFQGGVICRRAEILRYINRNHLSRKSSLSPALIAYDLIYLDGKDLTKIEYRVRREMLLSFLGAPKEHPFQGISSTRQIVINDPNDFDQCWQDALKKGYEGLVRRDINAPYRPGEISFEDFLITRENTVHAIIIRAKFGSGKLKNLLTNFEVAMRSDDELVAVGWASSGLSPGDVRDLNDCLQGLIYGRISDCVDIRPQVILSLKISGAVKNGSRLIKPIIMGVRYDASLEEADELDRLNPIYR
jgi:DNA ligase-1